MSSFVIVSPEAMGAAAEDLTGMGSALRAANAAAASWTTSLAVAAQDAVSAAIASLFGGYARDYQALSTQVALLHDSFVQAVAVGVVSYATAEATSAGPLQPLLDLINAPTNALFGRLPIGNGADRAPGTGQPGGAGGILWGDGGNGGSGAGGTGRAPGLA
ncbi:PE family protein [Mycobacterium kansasii]|uniref:PE-PGRS family protein PE_PGRS33 n=1 Tax=Mycobacterium attenuatum TaxID=2341086 RepID=A0A498PYU5_9MYCO|nr:PE family protein [Mycobacterium kansasii]VBA37255.1 PE-PGRS family protein PE_PGRS33 [Mycobacterium attenuatum]VBA50247.1 PE-PGRS family protein PE_PGRS33 [Mycobacterium attenuatum]